MHTHPSLPLPLTSLRHASADPLDLLSCCDLTAVQQLMRLTCYQRFFCVLILGHLCKLKAYGFQHRALDLLHSYLCSRLGRVRIGSVTSSRRNVERGCPQGSVLGPLLWNIFRNALSYGVDSGLSMYADDHQIYVKGKDICTVVAKLQESATLATNWYDSNLLQANLKKYQTMNIRNKSVNYGDKTRITINGKNIMESHNLELLGVTIDCGLNFNLHISNVCKKAGQLAS